MTLDPHEMFFLGVNGKVLAIDKQSGKREWMTSLPGFVGDSFVTVVVDGERIFAYTHGQVHALDLHTGRIQWSNDLPGCGHGFASIALSNGMSAPDPQIVAARERAKSDS